MKTRGMKRFVSLLISAAMATGVIAPLSAFAAENSITITTLENNDGIKVAALLEADGDTVTGETIAAVYNNSNELISVKSSVAARSVSFEFEGIENAGYVKLMWWDSLAGMTPIAESSTKYVYGSTPTSTPEVTATSTPEVTATSTPGVTATSTPEVTATTEPTSTPSVVSTANPTAAPSAEPTVEATVNPTEVPTANPITEPTAAPTAEPTLEPEEVTITGYTPIGTLVTDYVDRYASSYNLPEKITFNLSDGSSFEVEVWNWSFTDNSQIATGNTVTAKAILEDAPLPYRNTYYDYFEDMNDHPVTMQVTFNEAPPEVAITYDEAHLVNNVATYLYTENPVLTIENYTDDGSDISMNLGYDYNYKTLTNGDGLTYNADDNTVTIDSSEIMANGFVSTLSKYLKIGSKQLSVYIKYTTDRSVMFEGASESGSVSYSDVSWKTPLVKEVTFTNVPETDIDEITFKCSGYDITDKLTLTKKEDNVYTLTVPYDEVKSYISYGNRVSITMNVEGMSATTISIAYKATPSLTLDKSSYYAKENPVITLNNFSFENVDKENVVVSWNDSDSKKTLTKNTDYTLSENSSGKVTITINSAEALGTSTLDAAKTITLTVSAAEDSEEASVDISYKKNIAITVENVTDATPYTTALAKLGGSTDGYSGLNVYHGDTLLENVSATYDYNLYANVISIPYASVLGLLDENSSVTLTAKLTGSSDASFTVSYATVSEDGTKLPVDTIGSYSAKADENQDGLPAMAANAEIYVYTTDTTVSNSDWSSKVGVTIKKKDVQDSEEISVGVSYVYSIWDSSYNTIGYKVQLNSLSQYKEKLFGTSDEGGAFTLNFYKAGYAKTTLDIYLTNPS